MLFDLRSGKRRRVVQVVYSLLAASFLVGFVIFGIGSSGVGSVSDLFSSGGGGGDATEPYDEQIEKAEQTLATDPKNEAALERLAVNRYRRGSIQLGPVDETTGQPEVTSEAQQDFGLAADAWSDYLKVAGENADVGAALEVVNAFSFLADWEGAAETQAIIAEDKPSTNTYGTLAIYHYSAGQFEAGNEAAQKAIAEARGDDRKALERQFARVRKQAEEFLAAQEAAGEGGSAGAVPNPLANPFGGLGETGTVP